jgi:hypothetical protein
MVLLLSGAALAQGGQQKPKDDRPAGTYDSGAITLEQMTQGLQFLISKRYGIVVNYVLPQGWEVAEQAKNGTGPKDPGRLASLSRRPMADPKEPTDFIFELDIYEPDILSGLDANMDKKAKDAEIGKRFRNFLDAQMGINIKAGMKVLSKAGEIVPRQYGPDGTRPKTTLVPIRYQTKEGGATLHTFTGLTGGQVWQVKFLVNKDQEQTYGALMAIILNNTFALTDAQYEQLLKNTKAVQNKAKASGSAKPAPKNNKNTKGK